MSLFKVKNHLAFILFGLASGVVAPVLGATVGGGDLLQQANPRLLQPSNNDSGIKLNPIETSNLPASVPIEIKKLNISGNSIYGNEILHSLIAASEEKMLTLQELGVLADKISEYYRLHGYILTQAIIPPQKIENGEINIQVIEAKYGAIVSNNNSRTNNDLLEESIAELKKGDDINQEKLDQTLLLLSDIPGVLPTATLKPGEKVGTSDLIIVSESAPQTNASLSADNYGNAYTGRTRITGSANYLDPFNHGDLFNITALSSGSDMNYGRLSYETLLNGNGTRAGASVSTLPYSLSGNFSSLNAHGTAMVESLWGKHPILRGASLNLYAQVQFDSKKIQDKTDSTGIDTDRSLNNVTLSVNGDLRDVFLGVAVNTWSLSVTSGRVGFNNSDAQARDSQAGNTQGGFTKFNLIFSRLQELNSTDSIYVNFSRQWSNSNLDAAEKMVSGGAFTVRAYDMGVISGDTGYLGSLEIRHNLGQFSTGQWQAFAFVDSQHLTINRNPWSADVNSVTLSGTGVGMNWMGLDKWSARVMISTPLGAIPSVINSSRSPRTWGQLIKEF